MTLNTIVEDTYNMKLILLITQGLYEDEIISQTTYDKVLHNPNPLLSQANLGEEALTDILLALDYYNNI